MVRIGIVGTGGMGTVHYTNYSYIKDCQVVAVCGNEEKAKAWGAACYPDIASMAEAEQLDVIDICTPTFLHYPQVKEALRYCSVICEKPLTFTCREGEELFETAKAWGHHLYVAQVLRFFPEYKVLTELIENKTCGNVLDGYFWRLSAKPAWTSGGWMMDKAKSGLVPFDLHIHDLDYMVSLFGTPRKLSYTKAQAPEDDMAQQYRFSYEFEQEGRALNLCAEASWFRGNYPWSSGYRVCFEKAVLEARGGEAILYREGAEPEILDTSEKVKIPTGINIPPTGVYLEELEHFLDCVRKDEDSGRIKREQVLGVLKFLENINQEL